MNKPQFIIMASIVLVANVLGCKSSIDNNRVGDNNTNIRPSVWAELKIVKERWYTYTITIHNDGTKDIMMIVCGVLKSKSGAFTCDNSGVVFEVSDGGAVKSSLNTRMPDKMVSNTKASLIVLKPGDTYEYALDYTGDVARAIGIQRKNIYMRAIIPPDTNKLDLARRVRDNVKSQIYPGLVITDWVKL